MQDVRTRKMSIKRKKVSNFCKLPEEQLRLCLSTGRLIEDVQRCPSFYWPGDDVDVVVNSENGLVAKVKSQVLLVILKYLSLVD